jgi:hypothetical protein
MRAGAIGKDSFLELSHIITKLLDLNVIPYISAVKSTFPQMTKENRRILASYLFILQLYTLLFTLSSQKYIDTMLCLLHDSVGHPLSFPEQK